jgi:LDH2 family malate/lactate/ureidoglycolate dehydrogenase
MEKNVSRRILFDDLKGFCKEVYEKTGVPDEEAEIVADLLATSDLRGVETHGVTRLPIYIQRIL